MSLTIGLTYDLRNDYLEKGFDEQTVAEFDSHETIDALDATIRSLGYRTDRIGSAWSLCRRLSDGQRWDLVFNIAEGLFGRSREAQVPAILELHQAPYTFSDPLVCAATLDKAVAKRLVRDAGLLTAGFAVAREPGDLAGVELAYPLFVKPLCEGTGKGIDERSRIDDAEQLKRRVRELLLRYHQPVLIEEFLPGREVTVGVLGTGRDARVLGTMEIELRDPSQGGIYSYDSKERCEQLVRYFPMEKGPLRERVETLALQSYLALECRDAGRVDIRLDRSGQPCFMEVNPLPGLHPSHSDLPMIATQEGMPYAELIGSIITSALARNRSSDATAVRKRSAAS